MKNLFLSGIAVLTVSAVFTGCAKNNDLYDENFIKDSQQQQIENLKKDYANAFVQQFGSISSSQDWGFGRTSTTRAVTRTAVTLDDLTGYKKPTNAAYVNSFNNFNKYGKGIAQIFASADKSKFMTIKDLQEKGVKLENYYLQHIYKSTANGKGKGNGNTGAQHKDFQQLYAYNYKNHDYEVVTNFERGKNNKAFNDSENEVLKGFTFMLNMGTPDESEAMMFAWAPKKGDDGKNGTATVKFSKYAILEIEGDYYIGFDYTNIWDKKEYDFNGDFTGWIVRIAEAEPGSSRVSPAPVQARIFCEDMGELGDFDFNDVVFDAVLLENNDIQINVLASGATYDVSIDGVKVAMGKMTNTGVNEAAVQQFTIKAVNGEPKYANFGDIPVTVNPGGNAASYTLEAPIGGAPQKICTYVGVDWADEYVSIEEAYTGFKTWVNTAKPETWSENEVETLTDLDLSNN